MSITDSNTLADQPHGCWVLDVKLNDALLERLGDARELADRLQVPAGVVIIGEIPQEPQRLIRHGADHVCVVPLENPGQNSVIAAAEKVLLARHPRIVFCGGDAFGRECGLRLAARSGWRVASPALMVRTDDDGKLTATTVDWSGKMARQMKFTSNETVLVTLRPGVASARPADSSRRGSIEIIDMSPAQEQVVARQFIPANPLTTDIRHVERLISGGRGLGSAPGFDLLRRIAVKLDAGIAASRVAVDLGWIGHDHQVGQTGKTVKPDLYIACGISGASHHLDGMSGSTHIVAINTDPDAPIHAKAHLSLVADLHQVLQFLEQSLEQKSDQ
jgi:electron transfer flavoprotein alpha subunit